MILNFSAGILDIDQLESYDLTKYVSQVIYRVNDLFSITGGIKFNTIIYLSNQGALLGFTVLNGLIDSSKFKTIILKFEFSYEFQNEVGITFNYVYDSHLIEGEPHLNLFKNKDISKRPLSITKTQNYFRYESYFSCDIRRFLFSKSYLLLGNMLIGDKKFQYPSISIPYNGEELKFWQDGTSLFYTLYDTISLRCFDLITQTQVYSIALNSISDPVIKYSSKYLITENNVYSVTNTRNLTSAAYDKASVGFIINDNLESGKHLLSYEVGTSFSITNCLSDYLKNLLKSIYFMKVISSVVSFQNGIFHVIDELGTHYLINNYRAIAITDFLKVQIFNNKIALLSNNSNSLYRAVFLTEEDFGIIEFDLTDFNNFLTCKFRKSMTPRVFADYWTFMGMVFVNEGSTIKLL